MDEHRVGLQPVLRRVWAMRGQRPVVRVWPRYEWLYIYAFAQPTTGRSFYLLMPPSPLLLSLLRCTSSAILFSPIHSVRFCSSWTMRPFIPVPRPNTTQSQPTLFSSLLA